jgi:hypothetical protein
MTLAERIVNALLVNGERIARLEAENTQLQTKLANLGDLDKVANLLDPLPTVEPVSEEAIIDIVPAIEEKLPGWATQPDPALALAQTDTPINL